MTGKRNKGSNDYSYFHDNRSNHSTNLINTTWASKISDYFLKYFDVQRFRRYTFLEHNVIRGFENPLAKTLIEAIKKTGCPFDYRRNVSVEYCHTLNKKCIGGYDPVNKQIVVCRTWRYATQKRTVTNLVHSLTQMFDHCRAQTDFKPLDHLTCSLIRAYNFTDCKSSWYENVDNEDKKPHQMCICRATAREVKLLRPEAEESEIWDSVFRVFERCYNDREPFGRIPTFEKQDSESIFNYAKKHYDYSF